VVAEPPLRVVRPDDDRRSGILAVQIESILLVASEPVSIRELARLLETGSRTVEAAVDELGALLADRGIRLQRDDDRIQLVTAPENAHVVRRFLQLSRPNRLSRPALETLSIVAYRQPVTRQEIEEVRGVNVERVLAGLVSRGLIEMAGRRQVVGSPIEYVTTFAFLEFFGLESLDNLPTLDLESAPPPHLGTRAEDDAQS